MTGYTVNEELARRIRLGQKTQFRVPIEASPQSVISIEVGNYDYITMRMEGGGYAQGVRPSYGVAGQQIYFKEPWQIIRRSGSEITEINSRAYLYGAVDEEVVYKATYNHPEEISFRNPNHLPQRLAGISGRICNLRVERLLDISSRDIRNEGFDSIDDFIKEWNRRYARPRAGTITWGDVAYPSSIDVRRYHPAVRLMANPYVIVYEFFPSGADIIDPIARMI